MKLRDVRLTHFRNHEDSAIDCSPKINVFVGRNGEGKTNILEGISYLCLTKSFYATSDALALRKGAEAFLVRGTFETDGGLTVDGSVSYTGESRRKQVLLNGQAPSSMSAVVGEFPVVVLSPENNSITFGSPSERRKFIDLAISQASRTYLEDILEYRRVLRQRNRLLMDMRERRGSADDSLQPWTESLVRVGARIVSRRMKFVEEFRPTMENSFAHIAGEAEHPGLEYRGTVPASMSDEAPTVEKAFREVLGSLSREERQAGLTLAGPHRDDLLLTINDMDLRGYASQGQHKTYLVALKLAEWTFLRERCREIPLLLLDDVLSELDMERSTRLLSESAELGQTFVTATDAAVFDRAFGKDGYRRFDVQQGHVHAGA